MGALIMSKKTSLVAGGLLLGSLTPWLVVQRQLDSPAGSDELAAVETPSMESPAAPAAASAATSEALPLEPSDERQAPALPGVHFTGLVLSAEDGNPLPGARAWLGAGAEDALERELVARTDGSGRFQFDAVSGAEDSLLVDADGFAPYRAPLSTGHRPRGVEGAGGREAHSGREIDLGVFRLERGARVGGSVVLRETGEPVPGARLMLFEDHRPAFGLSAITDRVIGITGPEGRFEIDGLVAFRGWPHVLFAVGEGHMGWRQLLLADDLAALETLVVPLERTASLDVRISAAGGESLPKATIECVPHFDPWSRFDVRVAPPGRPLPEPFEATFTAQVDEAGTLRLASLPIPPRSDSGTMALLPSAEYLVSGRAEGFRFDDQVVTLEAGSRGRVELVAHRESVTSLAGTVVDEAGRPVPDARLTLHLVGRLSGPMAESHSRADGSFELEYAEGGERSFGIDCEASGFVEERHFLPMPPDGGTFDEVRLTLRRTGRLAGRAVDQEGNPLAGVELALRQSRGESRTTSRTDGTFEFEGVASDRGTVIGTPPQPTDEWRMHPVVQVEGGDRDVEVVFERIPPPRARLVIECVDAETGELLVPGEAKIQRDLEPGTQSFSGLRIQRERGLVSAERLRPGWWNALIAIPNRATLYRRFEIDEGDEEIRLRLEATRTASVSGTVRLGAYDWPETADVVLVHGWGGPNYSNFGGGSRFYLGLQAEPDGRFEVEGLTPGPWRIVLSGIGGPFSLEERLDLVPGPNPDFLFEPRPAARLRLVCADSTPPEIAVLWTRETDGSWRWTRQASERGRATPRNFTVWLPPGEVRWRLTFPDDTHRRYARDTAPPIEGTATLASGEETIAEYEVPAPAAEVTPSRR